MSRSGRIKNVLPNAATIIDGDSLPVTGGTLGGQLAAIDAQLAEIAEEKITVLKLDKEVVDLFGYAKSEESFLLPILKGQGAKSIELDSSGNLYMTNGNMFDLFLCKNGIYEYRGLTITITGNKIKIQGTSTGVVYAKLSGIFSFDGTQRGIKDYILPNNAYKMGLYNLNQQPETFDPTIFIRNNTNSGDVSSINPTNPVRLFADSANWGALYFYAGASRTYDCEFEIALVPDSLIYEENTKDPFTQIINSGDITLMLDGHSVFADSIGYFKSWDKIDVSKSEMYAMCVSAEKRLTVLTKTNVDDLYIGVDILHNYDVSIRANNYTLRNVNIYEFDGINFMKLPNTTIVASGEWDCAIKEVGKSDFMGGISHGDEVFSTVVIFIDGKTINIDTDDFVIPCNEVELYTKSNLLEEGNPIDNPRATHDKHIIINSKGIVVDQKVKFLSAIDVDNSYLCMLPIARDIGGTYVTNKGFMNNTYEVKDLSVAGNVITDTNVNTVTIYNDGLGHKVKARVELLESNNETDNYWMFMPATAYNKVYQRFVDSKTVSVNEVWKSKAKFVIEYSGFESQ